MSAGESQGRCGGCGGQAPSEGPCDWCARIAERTRGFAPYVARSVRDAVREALTAGRTEIANRVLLGEVPIPVRRSGV